MATLDYMALAQLGYNAYKEHLHIATYTTPDHGVKAGQKFKDMPVKVQQAWAEAALAISTDAIRRLSEDDK